MTELTTTLLGAIIGSLAGFLLTRHREKQVADNTAKSIRTVLSLEIDDNLTALTDYLNKLEQAKKENYPPAYLMQHHEPYFSQTMWESQIPHVVTALNADEIRQIHHFYINLNNLKDKLRVGHLDMRLMNESQFPNVIEPAITKLLKVGNPLTVPTNSQRISNPLS